MTERMLALIESLRQRDIPIMTHEEIMSLVKRGKVVLPPVALIVERRPEDGEQDEDKERSTDGPHPDRF